MNSKLIIISFLMIFTILIIGGIMIHLTFNTLFDKPVNSNKIIKKFQNNEQLFEEVLKELSEINHIHIDQQRNGNISIFIYENIDNKKNVKEVEQGEFYKYEKTIYIMEKLKIRHVWKEENIIFSVTIFGQDIVKMNNEEQYRWENNIKEIIRIKNNWYYVKTKT